MNREEKAAVVAKLSEWFNKSSSTVLVDFSYLNVAEINNLRSILKKLECGVRVARNRLIEISFKQVFGDGGVDAKHVAAFISKLKGSSMVICSFSDPIKPLKELYSFIDKNKKLQIKAVFFEKTTYKDSEVESLKNLPSRDECLSTLLNLLQTPSRNLLYLLNQPSRMVMTLLDNYSKKA